MRIRKRSSCDSGSAKVPSCSCGFCVATTKNGLGQRVGRAVGADLALLHGLEQRALRARAGAIDLIGEQQLREDRALAEVEAAGVARSNTDTPMMSAGSRSLVNCTRCQARPSTCASACASVVLPTPGHVLDQQVAARQQAGEAQADLRRLAEDDRLERLERARQAGRVRVGARRASFTAPASRARARAARSRLARGALEAPRRARARWRTTSAGALRTKFSLASLARVLRELRPGSWRAACRGARLRRPASISPAIGTSSVSVPTSATADCGGGCARRRAAVTLSSPASRSSSARWRCAQRLVRGAGVLAAAARCACARADVHLAANLPHAEDHRLHPGDLALGRRVGRELARPAGRARA